MLVSLLRLSQSWNKGVSSSSLFAEFNSQQFVGSRAPFPCCLSAGKCSQLLDAEHGPLNMVSSPSASKQWHTQSVSCFESPVSSLSFLTRENHLPIKSSCDWVRAPWIISHKVNCAIPHQKVTRVKDTSYSQTWGFYWACLLSSWEIMKTIWKFCLSYERTNKDIKMMQKDVKWVLNYFSQPYTSVITAVNSFLLHPSKREKMHMHPYISSLNLNKQYLIAFFI